LFIYLLYFCSSWEPGTEARAKVK